ncbi:hypothetical protein [Leucobacter sp. NPDC077196]|uniref:hypothetical protein n=1 Tax=Leucobacter sp. NPDC077196 TaxID=3154959 RepID=UPI00342ABC3B
MSSGQKARTPRYFPRMKVRGANRKRMQTMYAFQRLGDAGNASAAAIMGLGSALINMQTAINRMYERQNAVEQLYPPAEPYDMADLGMAIMRGA